LLNAGGSAPRAGLECLSGWGASCAAALPSAGRGAASPVRSVRAATNTGQSRCKWHSHPALGPGSRVRNRVTLSKVMEDFPATPGLGPGLGPRIWVMLGSVRLPLRLAGGLVFSGSSSDQPGAKLPAGYRSNPRLSRLRWRV